MADKKFPILPILLIAAGGGLIYLLKPRVVGEKNVPTGWGDFGSGSDDGRVPVLEPIAPSPKQPKQPIENPPPHNWIGPPPARGWIEPPGFPGYDIDRFKMPPGISPGPKPVSRLKITTSGEGHFTPLTKSDVKALTPKVKLQTVI